MKKLGMSGVGYCARMTPVGDWAFEFALRLALMHKTQLDIFFFPTSPCQEHPSRGRRGESLDMTEQEKIELEKEVRLYYDERLGDHEEVGFRLCEGDEEPELRRCLIGHEYTILVLAFEGIDCSFGRYRIVDFADYMPCPVVLVGPRSASEVYYNGPAQDHDFLMPLAEGQWRTLDEARLAPRMSA